MKMAHFMRHFFYLSFSVPPSFRLPEFIRPLPLSAWQSHPTNASAFRRVIHFYFTRMY
ncbi:hypothetical protein BN1221_03779c [Brenneria goodwinii]|uniref:Uncharacterized protein n=1 Tax=Brenneria goodwinii TaxID=1109412 RepID=A0A0G4K010_9GAMM|nr:hypothetical protein BN1221_03779c [Brenneria goodwinii]